VSLRAAAAPVVAIRSIRRCRPLVQEHDVVVGMGGYVSVPVALAAIGARRPLVLHEQNAVPGLANRTFARRARTIALSFAQAARLLPRRTPKVVTGNPVREEILAVHADRDRLAKEAASEFDLDPERPTVVVFGGSQGALHLNRAAVDAAGRVRSDAQLMLIAGPAHAATIDAALRSSPLTVRVFAFVERMDLAYAIADLVVARAGASAVAEISVSGAPSLLIPYPYATGRHQEANARALVRAGGATVLLDDDLTGETLAARVDSMLGDAATLRSMGEQARAWSRPDAADALARVVVAAADDT
jgi:UDP-N-acetylglucosamine--N-acetylmuramyl-(pentapeptide) pyrophosphoryl-undecaprenol N-acetylglucosamine transferase